MSNSAGSGRDGDDDVFITIFLSLPGNGVNRTVASVWSVLASGSSKSLPKDDSLAHGIRSIPALPLVIDCTLPGRLPIR
jgi:hypothetical protein